MKMPRLLFRVAAFFFLLTGSAGAQAPAPQWPSPQDSAVRLPSVQPKPATPSYIKADRSSLQGFLEARAIDYIFSDQLTQDRRAFVLRSLQRIPAPGCPDNPAFTLTHIAPVQRVQGGSVWSESFEIDCNPKIRRTRAFQATNVGATSFDLVPGESRTHNNIPLQNDAYAGLLKIAASRVSPPCGEAFQLRDTRFSEDPMQSATRWKERWIFWGCGKSVEIDVVFFADLQGKMTWTLEYSPSVQAPAIIQPLPPVPVAPETGKPQLVDENLVIGLPSGYKIGHQQRSQTQVISEMVPNGQSVQDWTEMVTIQIFFWMKRTPEDFQSFMTRSWSGNCPGSSGTAINKSTENGYPAGIFMLSCPFLKQAGKPEITWFKVIQGNDALYVVQKAFKFTPAKEQIESWTEYLKKASVCDSRKADHPCPSLSPLPR